MTPGPTSVKRIVLPFGENWTVPAVLLTVPDPMAIAPFVVAEALSPIAMVFDAVIESPELSPIAIL